MVDTSIFILDYNFEIAGAFRLLNQNGNWEGIRLDAREFVRE